MSTTHCKDEIALLREEIIQVEDKRCTLLRRMNSLQSATRNLPPETLFFIFKHYIASPTPVAPTIPWEANSHLGLLLLGHVFSYWRQVIWSTPQFWTSLSLSVRVSTLGGMPGVLELYLKNVGDCPFNLDLSFPYTRSTSAFGKPIKDVLSRYSRKIHRLRLSDLPSGWFDTLREFSSLEWLTILSVSDHGNLVLTTLPQLRHISLCRMNSDIQLPWKTVTTLELNQFPTYKCATLLTQCPNLVKFSSKLPNTPNLDPSINLTNTLQSLLRTPITLCQLQDFYWSYRSGPLDQAVFQNVRLPALSALHLDIYEGRFLEGDESNILTFFNNLKDTLQVLTMVRIPEWTVPFTKNIFRQSPSLRKMTLYLRNVASLSSILRTLCPGWDDSTTYLPHLGDLTIICRRFQPEEIFKPEISSQILDFCRARSVTPYFKLSLYFDNILLTWAPGVLRELNKMVRDGFGLYIKHSKGVVQWLS